MSSFCYALLHGLTKCERCATEHAPMRGKKPARWIEEDVGSKEPWKLTRLMITSIVPVDLNALICGNFEMLAHLFLQIGDKNKAAQYHNDFQTFREDVQNLFYSDGGWFDFNLKTRKLNKKYYGSIVVPLFARCYHAVDVEETERMFAQLELFDNVLKHPFGVPTSAINTEQQWDFPNIWPPLAHMLVESLRRSGSQRMEEKAKEIARRWVSANYELYTSCGRHMWEKLAADNGNPGIGGEYVVQIGFGWTNGGVLDLLVTYGDEITKLPGLPEVKDTSQTLVELVSKWTHRISNRASTPYPEIVEAADSPSSLPLHLAESAANASMELQQQLNLMAQAIAIQNAPSASSATLTLLSQQSTANSATNLRGASNSGLSNMLDQYISATAAAAVTAIQQQQLQLAHLAVAPYNQQIATVSSTPATVANLPAPLAAYLQTAASSQPSPVDAAIQLLQHTQDNASSAGQPQTNPTISLFSTLCPCNVSAIDATATTPCPFHSQQHNNNGSSNSQQATANLPLVTIGGPPAQLGQQQRQHTILVGVTQSNSSIGQQRLLRSSSIIQHPPSSAAVGLAAAIQSHRMARSSLKRPSNGATTASAASVNGPAEEEGVLSGTAAAVHVSSPPPLLISPNATSVRLSSGLGHPHDGDGGGPSRGPKLRRLASFGEMIASDGEITPRTQLSGHMATSDLTEFRAPSVASASTAVTSVAAAIVQLQQQAAVAALPSAVTFFSSLASASPPSTAIANSHHHQQQHNLLSHHSLARDTTLSSPPSVATPVADPTTASLAAELSTSSASLSAGVEQIVAAALNAATAANAAFSPQTIAAMAAATAFPPQNASAAPQCAVCAAAACQSRMGPSMAAAVTACSCLHHHHHHLHCHHNALVPPPPFPVCSLCNYVASSGSPSPSTTTMPQTLQNQHASNSNYLNNSNNSCINANGTSFVGNSHGTNRNGASGGVSASLQPTAQIVPIAQRYLAMNSSALMGNNNGGGGNERVPLSNNISANVNIHASAGGSSAAMAAAAALSPSTVTAMLLNSAAAMGQHNHLPQLVQTSPSIYSLQRNLAMSDFAASQQTLPNVTSMQQSLLVNRMAQQEREREAINHFYQQQQQQRAAAVNAAAAAAAASQQHHLMRPLIMANVLLLHNSGNVGDAATLVLNGSTNAASALAHATNPHHIVANAMATATAPEPQPVGVSLDQIKKHSQKMAYVKDPDRTRTRPVHRLFG
uniref:Trehalase n=1 Tax=Globodera pallida TaxID=36090 RepID=A0A183BUW3_GLOPA